MARTTSVEVLITVPLSGGLVEQLREVSPLLKITQQPTARTEDISSPQWAKTEVLYTDNALPEINQATNLHWVQSHYAGVDFIVRSPLIKKTDLMITSLSGALAPKIAEFVIAMMLALGYRLPEILANQSRRGWGSDKNDKLMPGRELRGSTAGIIGYGSIGRELARLLYPFGITILAAKRDAMNPRDSGYIPEGLGDPDGNLFHRLYPIQALKSMIKECDFVINTLPLTTATRGLINADILSAFKPTAYLIDISRSGIVDDNALLAALENNKLAGAALDVFITEPLPADSPLWKAPNLIVSPHIAGISTYYHDRAVLLFIENIKRYLEGVALLNRFDPNKGY